jgi:rhamnulokinase
MTFFQAIMLKPCGGVKNCLLNQFSADATGQTLIAGPVETTAIGNILMQMITLGDLATLQDAQALVRRSFGIEEYHPGDSEGWESAYKKLNSILFP